MSNKIKFIKNLIGFSGCEIKLYSTGNNNLFVRKISSSKGYNHRLKKQMEKQIFFFNNLSKNKITTPKVLGCGFRKGLFFFDMEYIIGLNLIDKISSATNVELEEISKTILEIISLEKSNKLGEVVALSDKFSDKLNELSTKIPKNQIKLLTQLKQKCKILPEVETTFCHGDLTLENILYDESSKKYYLIDFLDNFADHYWFDIAKLFQDIEAEWYVFRNPNIDRNSMGIKINFIKQKILKFLKLDYLPFHSIFMAMTLFRIVPYASELNYPFLLDKISKNLNDNKKLVN